MPRKNPPRLRADNEKEQPAPLDPGMLKGRNPARKLPSLKKESDLPLEYKRNPPSELTKLNEQHQKHVDHQKTLAQRLLAASGSAPFLSVPVSQSTLAPSGQAKARSKDAEQQQKHHPTHANVEVKAGGSSLFNDSRKRSQSPASSRQEPTRVFPINKRSLTPAGQARASGAVPAGATVVQESVSSKKQQEKYPELKKLTLKKASPKKVPKTPLSSPRAPMNTPRAGGRPASAKSSVDIEYGVLDTSRARSKHAGSPPNTPRLFESDAAKNKRGDTPVAKEKAKKTRSRSPGSKS